MVVGAAPVASLIGLQPVTLHSTDLEHGCTDVPIAAAGVAHLAIAPLGCLCVDCSVLAHGQRVARMARAVPAMCAPPADSCCIAQASFAVAMEPSAFADAHRSLLRVCEPEDARAFEARLRELTPKLVGSDVLAVRHRRCMALLASVGCPLVPHALNRARACVARDVVERCLPHGARFGPAAEANASLVPTCTAIALLLGTGSPPPPPLVCTSIVARRDIRADEPVVVADDVPARPTGFVPLGVPECTDSRRARIAAALLAAGDGVATCALGALHLLGLEPYEARVVVRACDSLCVVRWFLEGAVSSVMGRPIGDVGAALGHARASEYLCGACERAALAVRDELASVDEVPAEHAPFLLARTIARLSKGEHVTARGGGAGVERVAARENRAHRPSPRVSFVGADGWPVPHAQLVAAVRGHVRSCMARESSKPISLLQACFECGRAHAVYRTVPMPALRCSTRAGELLAFVPTSALRLEPNPLCPLSYLAVEADGVTLGVRAADPVEATTAVRTDAASGRLLRVLYNAYAAHR